MRRALLIAWLVIAPLAHPFSMPPAVGSEVETEAVGEKLATRSWLGSPWSDLKAEFDRICGQLQVAPSLNEAEIRLLIEDSRALREALLQSENPQAKVFLKRLQMCEDFFEYSLEVQPDEIAEGLHQ
ncbi:MAG: hypothetical protein KC572_10300 [Gammaproteobacteria bacterium]|nr:hypothetical protein [Gammaproteobacteria bacterium]